MPLRLTLVTPQNTSPSAHNPQAAGPPVPAVFHRPPDVDAHFGIPDPEAAHVSQARRVATGAKATVPAGDVAARCPSNAASTAMEEAAAHA